MENLFQIFLISIIQGITEFVPVSSSAHIILLSKIFDYEKTELRLNISAHFGSLIAVIIFFRLEIFQMRKNKNLFFKIIISSIPLIIVGYFLVKYQITPYLRSLEIMGWATIIFGIVIYFADKFETSNSIKKNFDIKNAIIVGCFQILALIPGASRSGVTITGTRLLKFNRVDSAKIAFLLSIPALGASSIYGVYELINQDDLFLNIGAIFTAFLSFLFSYFTIKYFLIYLKKFNLNLFVIYRLILGFIILFVVYL